MSDNDTPDIPTDVIAETENYTIWVAEEPDDETTYHLELGQVTVHFFQEEWDEFIEMVRNTGDLSGDDEEPAIEVELDWGSLYFALDEWKEFLRLIKQVD